MDSLGTLIKNYRLLFVAVIVICVIAIAFIALSGPFSAVNLFLVGITEGLLLSIAIRGLLNK
jgi:hypothetical protein